MKKLIARRLLALPPTMLLASFMVFGLIYMVPGDPAIALAGEFATKEQVIEIRQKYGFDDPFFLQYGRWLGHVFTGDLGTSLRTREPVIDVLASRAVATVSLMVGAMLLAVIIGVGLGVIGGIREGRRIDSLITGGTMLGIAVPDFWLGMIAITVFSTSLGWLPAIGFPGWGDGMGAAAYLVLPCLTISTSVIALLARQTRAGVAEAMSSDHTRTHEAMGLPRRQIVWKYALRNASLPVLTIAGIQGAHLLGGAVVVETLFGIAGIGSLAAQAAINQDYPVVQGAVLAMGVVVIFANLLVDICYRLIDPRVRVGSR